MKQTPTAFLGLLLAFSLAGCQSGRQTNVATAYNISLTGAPNTPFGGTLREDGKIRTISGIVPAEYQVVGRQIDCKITRGSQDGELNLTVTRGGEKVASYSSQGSLMGIRFKVHHGGLLHSTSITGF